VPRNRSAAVLVHRAAGRAPRSVDRNTLSVAASFVSSRARSTSPIATGSPIETLNATRSISASTGGPQRCGDVVGDGEDDDSPPQPNKATNNPRATPVRVTCTALTIRPIARHLGAVGHDLHRRTYGPLDLCLVHSLPTATSIGCRSRTVMRCGATSRTDVEVWTGEGWQLVRVSTRPAGGDPHTGYTRPPTPSCRIWLHQVKRRQLAPAAGLPAGELESLAGERVGLGLNHDPPTLATLLNHRGLLMTC